MSVSSTQFEIFAQAYKASSCPQARFSNLLWTPRLFRTFEVFRNHVYLFHTDDETTSTPDSSNSDNSHSDSTNPEDLPPESSFSARKIAAATWILKIQEIYKIPQSTMEKIITDITGFIQDLLTDLRDDVNSTLADADNVISPSSLSALSSLFDHSSSYANPFGGLENQYLQLRFYKKAFNFVVSVKNYMHSA